MEVFLKILIKLKKRESHSAPVQRWGKGWQEWTV